MSERGPAQINIPRDYFYHEGKNLEDLIPQDEDEVRLNFKTGFLCPALDPFLKNELFIQL